MQRIIAVALFVLFTIALPHGDAVAARAMTFENVEVYVYGHALTPPIILSEDGTAVRLNGIQVFPDLSSAKSRGKATSPLSPRDQFMVDVFNWQREMEATGLCPSQITPAMVERYRSTPALVDSITGITEDGFLVWWKGESAVQEIQVRCTTTVPMVASERITYEFEQLQETLAKGGILIIATKGGLKVPANDTRQPIVRDEIRLAQTMAEDDITVASWTARIIPLSVARQFANPVPITLLRGQ